MLGNASPLVLDWDADPAPDAWDQLLTCGPWHRLMARRLEAAIVRGVRLLDCTRPDWFRAVALDRFDLSRPDQNLAFHLARWLGRPGPVVLVLRLPCPAGDLGFVLPWRLSTHPDAPLFWAALTAAWVTVIRFCYDRGERRDAAQRLR